MGCYRGAGAFRTVISQYEETAVSKEVYDEYRRSEWRISKNNDKHAAHETPFSALNGGDDGKVENFHEFLSDEEGPEKLIDKKGLMNTLRKAILSLNRSDQELVEALLFKGMSEREYAEQTGVFRNAIHKRKQRILCYNKDKSIGFDLCESSILYPEGFILCYPSRPAVGNS